MSLSFLNPFFLLGALALAAPVWLHLGRRHETEIFQFSALRFLDDAPQPRSSPLRLRDLLLFLFRALALLSVVAAFAWPYLRAANAAPVRESRVYILDNTLSHQANDGFIHDRDRVAAEVRSAAADLQVAVVELAALPRVVVSFGDSRQDAVARIGGLQPSYERGSYLAAFRQAGSLLANSLGGQKRIVFLGDNQRNQWAENPGAPPFLRDVQVDLPKPSAAPLPNLSLSEPQTQRIFLGDKSLADLNVKLHHTGGAKTATIVLRANGQVIFNREVPLENQPETILVQAQWETDPAIWLQGEATVSGTPDALAGDNRVVFSLAPVAEGTVALLAQSPFLRLALSPEIMRGQWATRVLEPSGLAAELADGNDADVLCLESNYLQSGDARKLLWRYLRNGRGVILLVNRVTPAVKEAMRELGFEVEGAANPGKVKPEKFQFVYANHPIFHPFLSPDFGNLSEITVSKYAILKSAQALPLVFSEQGAGLFFQGTTTPGRLFVTAFGLDREDTSWPIHQTFVPFLDLALQAARAEDSTPASYEPGEAAVFQLPAGTKAREAVLRAEGREVSRVPVLQGKAEFRLPKQPGLYALTCDEAQSVQRVICVNPSPKESDLTFADPSDTMAAWLQPPSPTIDPAQAATAQTRMTLARILQQRYWWWMVLAALAALTLETAWTALRRQSA